MAHCYGDPIPLVPGADWGFRVATLNEDGSALNVSTWIVTSAKVEWSGGEIEVDVDLSDAGWAAVSAGNADTVSLPYGKVSKLTIWAQSPGGEDRPIVYKEVDGRRFVGAADATVQILGVQGNPGVKWRGDWSLALGQVVIDDGVLNDGSSYRCIAAHTAAADNEPGVGADWEDFWAVLALGSDVDSVAAVAAIAAQIVTVANISGELVAIAPYTAQVVSVAMNIAEVIEVAGISASVVVVAGSAGNVDLVAGSIGNVNLVVGDLPNIDIAAINIAGILAAPQAAIDAGTYRDQALGYKDEAAANALTTAGLKAAVDTIYANLVTLYGSLGSFNPTLAQLTGAAARVVAQTDVVAVFVYDTAKDSDGGAWRFKTVATSWFNETLNTATRGSRRQFPSKALIVVRPASVTIYDLDDAACPMWMVFNAPNTSQHARSTTLSSAACANGILVTGGNQGVARIDFIRDVSVFSNATFSGYWTDGRIVSRNSDTAVAAGSTYGLIANIQVNAVAVTVLPGTPVDPIRKLPTPTIAVGTTGGVSVVHYDGRIANSIFGSAVSCVSFAANGTLWYGQPTGVVLFFSHPCEYIASGFQQRWYSAASVPAVQNSNDLGICALPGGGAKASALGLSLLRHEPGSGLASPGQTNRSSVAYITRTYNTGWMVGDIKMALAESAASLTNLVGATPLNDALTTDANVDSTPDGWVDNNLSAKLVDANGWTTTASADFGGGYLVLTGLTVGIPHRFLVDTSGAGSRFVTIYDGSGGITGTQLYTGSTNNNSQQVALFTPTSGTVSIRLMVRNAAAVVTWKNARVDRVAVDRSVAGNHPVVVGTITRSAVASGAELAAYGGFAAGSYLEMPVTSAFNFGLNDFCATAWVKPTSFAAQSLIFDFADGGLDNSWFVSILATTGVVRFSQRSTSAATVDGPAIALNAWTSIVIRRRSATTIDFIVNGVVTSVAITSKDVTNAAGKLRIGNYRDGSLPFAGNIALPRIFASLPTPAQARLMYEDERKLFEPGAKCLLTVSDNVQAVSYDAKTDLLYAGKAAGGTDVFKGLSRVTVLTRDSENAFGPEQIVNGDFATDTVWTKAAGWTIGGGKASVVAGGAAVNISQPISAGLSSKLLRISFDVLDYAAGNIFVRLIGSTTVDHPSPTPAANGTFVVYITAPAGLTTFAIRSSSVGVASIDNVSVKEVTTIRLTSDNHKGVSADNDNVAIFTDQEVYQKTPAVGLREFLTKPDALPGYDRTLIRAPSAAVTTNATPTVIGYLPMDKGEAGEWVIRVSAREYGEPSAPELASYEVRVTVHRPQEGNAAVAGSATYTVVSEVTSSMDLTVAANTTVQALALTGTGIASKNIEWGYEARFAPSVQQVAA